MKKAKTFEELLQEEIKKLSPISPLNAGEIVAIKEATKKLLIQKRERNEELLKSTKGPKKWHQNLKAGIWIIDVIIAEDLK